MKVIKTILMTAVVVGIASLFVSAVSAADQTDSQLIVKDENADFRAVNQTTGQNENKNISKIDLNGAAKPEETINVENSTVSEPINSEASTPIQSVENSTEIGKEANSNGIQFGNGRELTIEEMKSIKGKDWIENTKRFVRGAVTPIIDAIRPAFNVKLHINRTDISFEAGGHM